MLTLRPAKSSDARDLALIGLAAWQEAISAWGEDVEKMRENATSAYVNFCVRNWPDILVAEWDGDLAGWGASENADDQITDLWVAPVFQGRGIGSELLADLELEIRGRGFDRARLDTHARNVRAIHLFKRHGYRVSAYTVAYSAALDVDIDTVAMVKEFGLASSNEGSAKPEDDGLYGGV
ncbi:ribosomal-protein-alanine N-acetyltransferase [Hoeflea marina]|uniref:Ribosomal-protein-alanine N-acetyltransferase n=1 Tax=Hoeflea marina TaxID=274592 RepID=A0A317PVF2_9HYPH|nr:GNAT family N-acetyltransferase [Hoeflea marina]PWW04256.1 ribosomal-protein-alanine N-acetyltransferase [Hoeflea marina]